MARKYLITYHDNIEALRLLSDAERGRLYLALLEYSMKDEDYQGGNRQYENPKLSGNERFMFEVMKAQIDRDNEKYRKICDKNRINGANGGRPRKSDMTDEENIEDFGDINVIGGVNAKPKKPTGFFGLEKNPEKPKETHKNKNKNKNNNIKESIFKNIPKKSEVDCLNFGNQKTHAVKNELQQLIDNYTENKELKFELNEYLKIRKAKKVPTTERAIQLNLNKLSKLADNDEGKIEIVQRTIEHGWTSFFPSSEGKSGVNRDGKSSYDIDAQRRFCRDTIMRPKSSVDFLEALEEQSKKADYIEVKVT